jgi:uncharacterized protein YjbI with pentapeptide repeats
MFSFKKCSHNECQQDALFNADTCARHLKIPEQYIVGLKEYLSATKKFEKLNFSGICLEDIDLSEKEFLLCNMSHMEFTRVNFQKCIIRLVFFDFSLFSACDFRETNMTESVFAGSKMNDCDFKNSDICRCNFIGLTGENSTFSDSDLYGSRFINANLDHIEFEDCNLKRTHFRQAQLTEVNFRYSNVEEAYFDGVNKDI